jgi:nucleotide-binding universal stress UspA family protein
MSEQEEELTIQRILVALDTSHHSLAALRAAAELASSLEAELHGLFVEDVDLLRVAALPMARELQFPFARHARMNPGRMRRQLRAQARQARQALSSICKQRQIEWTFTVVRGHVSSKVLEEAAKADLLCVGRASRPVMERPETGSTARAAATSAQPSVLVISQRTRIQAPVVVIYDGSREADRALQLARRFAREIEGFLSILVPADPSISSEELQDRLTDRLDGEDMVVRYRELAGSGVVSIIRGVQTEGCGTLVVSRALLRPDEISQLLDEMKCPVLLVE